MGTGWNPIFGNFEQSGISFEWHDFAARGDLDWGRTFHPNSIELCLNLGGSAAVSIGKTRTEIVRQSAAFYYHGGERLTGERTGQERHQFLTVEYAVSFIECYFKAKTPGLHPVVRTALQRGTTSDISPAQPLTSDQAQLVHSLRNPPVPSAALALWYRGKALELAAQFFFAQPAKEDLFCHRQNLVAQERVQKVIAILRENLVAPPTLDQIGAQVGCSPFYLSRTFSKEIGMTLPQFVRKLRMERAADLLRGGKFNVTEAALEVGYSSLSHFSQAFHETFGVCPGLYPILPSARQPQKKP